VNNGGISLLPHLLEATPDRLGEAVAAYLRADRESGAQEQRRRVLELGLSAQAEHEALLKIESSLVPK
jgi:hypothetical protein